MIKENSENKPCCDLMPSVYQSESKLHRLVTENVVNHPAALI